MSLNRKIKKVIYVFKAISSRDFGEKMGKYDY